MKNEENRVPGAAVRQYLMQERLVRFLAEGQRDISESAARRRVNALKLALEGPLYAVAEMSMHLDQYPPDKIDGFLLHMEELTGRWLTRAGLTHFLYPDSRNSLIIVLSLRDELQYAEVDRFFSYYTEKAVEDTAVLIYTGIGRLVSTLSSLKLSANDARECISYKYSAAQKNVVHIKNVRRLMADTAAGSGTAFDRVIGCFLDGDMVRLEKRLDELLCGVEGSSHELRTVRQIYLELTTQIMHRAAGGDAKRSQELNENVQYILAAQSGSQLRLWFLGKCEEYIRLLRQRQSSNSSRTVDLAKQYIQRNYGDPAVSQQSVSDHLGLSVGYFGQLFYQQTGQRFVDYLQRYRLAIAKERLMTTNDRVKDISAACGFSSVNYFNQLFKKRYGVTPNQQRKASQ